MEHEKMNGHDLTPEPCASPTGHCEDEGPLPHSTRSRFAWLLGACLAAGSLLPLAGCRPETQAGATAEAPPPPQVYVTYPVERPLAETRDYTGHLEAVETVQIRARVRGVLQKIHFREGAEVKQGDLLYEIEPSEYEAAVEQHKADIERLNHQLALAESEAKRSTELYRKEAISTETWESAQAQLGITKAELAKAKAALKRAELDLSYTKIYAPIPGRIGRTLVTEGNLVGYNESTLLTTLVKVDPIYVYFEIPERDLLAFETVRQQASQPDFAMEVPLRLGLETETGHPHVGVANFADNQVDAETGTILIRGTLKNDARKLLPGLFARVRLTVGPEEPRLLVPETALAADQRGRYVLVVGEDNVVEQRPVQIDLNFSNKGYLVIREGIEAGDRIIVSGLQKARVKQPVTPIDAAEDMLPPTELAAAPAADRY